MGHRTAPGQLTNPPNHHTMPHIKPEPHQMTTKELIKHKGNTMLYGMLKTAQHTDNPPEKKYPFTLTTYYTDTQYHRTIVLHSSIAFFCGIIIALTIASLTQ